MRRVALVAVAIGLAACVFYHLYAVCFFSSGSRTIFEVASGASAHTVAENLEKEGLIKSAFIFKLYLKKEGVEQQIKAGRFVIPERATMSSIARILVSGKGAELPLTFLEGWTADEIGAELERQGLTTREAFVICVRACAFSDFDFLPKGFKEGYLFPDTYFVNPADYDNRILIKRMISNFKNRLSDDWAAIKKSPHSFDEIVKMASIVEAEESAEANRPVVAGILWKRYDHGIGLAADATVRYALKKRTGLLTQDDLTADSLYNTRKYRGLPPTAIGNPGLASLRAAIYPEASDFLYYLHGKDGAIHYAETLQEHNENKLKYL